MVYLYDDVLRFVVHQESLHLLLVYSKGMCIVPKACVRTATVTRGNVRMAEDVLSLVIHIGGDGGLIAGRNLDFAFLHTFRLVTSLYVLWDVNKNTDGTATFMGQFSAVWFVRRPLESLTRQYPRPQYIFLAVKWLSWWQRNSEIVRRLHRSTRSPPAFISGFFLYCNHCLLPRIIG
ncbi:hypothetical protein TcWFU_005445 [Taenia crassiceps]|uniref:Uncharacterized protein n=1 Tax=Taenia crassiceps TaxID=6207 RepID=A0ABR4Q7T0_9CEST